VQEEFQVVIEDMSGMCLASNRVANLDTFRKPASFCNIEECPKEPNTITDPTVFLSKTIKAAKSSNSQLCVTGNAFNKLF
jgi:hypothetical protein